MTGGLRRVAAAAAILLAGPGVCAQTLRPGLGAGMGVNYVRMADVVALANGAGTTSGRIPEFNAGVEFFGRATWPLSEEWALALDYAYQVTSLNAQSPFGGIQFTVVQHTPTLLIERVLAAEPLYSLVAGIGIGLHAGILEQEPSYYGGRFTASGPALLALLEGNTSLGGDLFASIGGTVRWGWVGRLTDESGRSPGSGTPGGSAPATLHQFSVGARLGLTYDF